MLLLDVLFMILHTFIILFNLTGWIWKSTRLVHRAVLSLTLFSWLILGYYFGWGYCFLTDWHYWVLRQRGFTDLPNSFITFWLNRMFRWHPDEHLVDLATGVIFGLVVVITFGRYAWDLARRTNFSPRSNPRTVANARTKDVSSPNRG